MKVKLYDSVRPIFDIKSKNGKMMPVLLDTGAIFSVWRGTVKSLYDLDADAKHTHKKTLIIGFDGIPRLCDVYTISEISIGDLTIYNIPVAIYPDEKSNCDLILASSLLSKNPFRIDYYNKILDIDDSKKEVGCSYKTDYVMRDMITSFYVFVQNSATEIIRQSDNDKVTSSLLDIAGTIGNTKI